MRRHVGEMMTCQKANQASTAERSWTWKTSRVVVEPCILRPATVAEVGSWLGRVQQGPSYLGRPQPKAL